MPGHITLADGRELMIFPDRETFEAARDGGSALVAVLGTVTAAVRGLVAKIFGCLEGAMAIGVPSDLRTVVLGGKIAAFRRADLVDFVTVLVVCPTSC